MDELVIRLNEAIGLSSPVTQADNGRAERLRTAHAEAVAEIERIRNQPGQLTTGINGDVGRSILEGGVRALADVPDDQEARQFVVAAPPGTGKTSHAIALMAATVRTADKDDLSKPFGCLFVVDQIKKADDMYRQINELLPGHVAVWTSDHDVNSINPTTYVHPERRFDVDQLEQHAIAVVTQAFLRGPRGDKARQVIRGNHRVPRALTIFDEQTKEVEVYDIKPSQAEAVREAIESDRRFSDLKSKLDPLIEFLRAQSKKTGNSIDTPNDDPEVWRVARELGWFAGEDAEQFVLTNGRHIEYLEEVFGFAAQMYRNYAFIFRRGGGDMGSNFVAYVPAPSPDGNSILLDATADVDGVSELVPWRTHIAVPRVRYDNLHIVHAYDHTRENLNEFLKHAGNRRKYAEHIEKLILDVMQPGARGLIVCKKRLVDDRAFLRAATNREAPSIGDQSNRFPWEFEGRHLAVTWWGDHGIGANDWKDADYVFEFGEHFLPTRTMFATVQGLRGDTATKGVLGETKSTNITPDEVHLATQGHLLRFLKQLGMRGRARKFDSSGICGKQVLVLTCDFERLLVHADQLFPGATLSKWRPKHPRRKLTQPEKLMETLADPDAPDSIPGDDIAKRMGVEKWSALSTNAMTPNPHAKAIGATVVFAKLDRLTRNVDLLRSLVASDVDLVFCDLPHVPPGAMGRFLLTQMASVAELEAGLISERTKAALAAAKARGVKLGNPNGARALRGKQVGNKRAVAAVKANAAHRAANLRGIVDDLRSQGITSVRCIASELNKRGILTPRGGIWHPTSAARLLSRLAA